MQFKAERGRVTCALYNPHYRAGHAIRVVVAIAQGLVFLLDQCTARRFAFPAASRGFS
ncbi:hypothetical protein [Xanthomonas campestris]|uniref:hypothetical protein n=1 Tax=Xanthomonas campestris TaxID=339 RepID=UPI00356B733A